MDWFEINFDNFMAYVCNKYDRDAKKKSARVVKQGNIKPILTTDMTATINGANDGMTANDIRAGNNTTNDDGDVIAAWANNTDMNATYQLGTAEAAHEHGDGDYDADFEHEENSGNDATADNTLGLGNTVEIDPITRGDVENTTTSLPVPDDITNKSIPDAQLTTVDLAASSRVSLSSSNAPPLTTRQTPSMQPLVTATPRAGNTPLQRITPAPASGSSNDLQFNCNIICYAYATYLSCR
jgi:hypothetical protein